MAAHMPPSAAHNIVSHPTPTAPAVAREPHTGPPPPSQACFYQALCQSEGALFIPGVPFATADTQ
jgi:hypothetical protein